MDWRYKIIHTESRSYDCNVAITKMRRADRIMALLLDLGPGEHSSLARGISRCAVKGTNEPSSMAQHWRAQASYGRQKTMASGVSSRSEEN